MEALFLTVWNLTLIGSLTAAVVLAVRFFLKRRAPRWISYALWGIVLIRLLVPVSVTSPISLFSLIPAQSTDVVGETGRLSRLDVADAVQEGWDQQETRPARPEAGMPAEEVRTENTEASSAPAQTEENAKSPVGLISIAAAIWMAGAVGLGGFFLVTYVFAAWRVHKLRLLPENRMTLRAERLLPLRRPIRVSRSRMFAAPVVFGILRPRIVLPKDFDWEDPAVLHILLHERVHIRRWDNLAKILATAAVCIHWFNPVVWLCFRLCSDDMEASCDERVLKALGEHSRKDYAKSLLSMAEAHNRRMGVMPFLAFGESDLRKRVGNILAYHKKTLLSVTAAVLAVALVGCSLLTNPSQPEEDGGQSQSQSGAGEESLSSQDEEPQNEPETVPVTLYAYWVTGVRDNDSETEGYYLPLQRYAPNEVDAQWITDLMQSVKVGNYYNWFQVDRVEKEGDAITVSVSHQDDGVTDGELYDRNSKNWMDTVATTLLENGLAGQVSFVADGEPYGGGAYAPTPLTLPDMSREEIAALYETVDFETLVENVRSFGDYHTVGSDLDISRWDLAGDETAKELLDAINDATLWNNIPEAEFDSIEEAPNSFILNAAYSYTPQIYWHTDAYPNKMDEFSVLTELINDFSCLPAPVLEQAVSFLFGEDVSVTHEKPRYGYWNEYAMCYTPYHMGGWYPEIYLLDAILYENDTADVWVAYGIHSGGAMGTKGPQEMSEEEFVRGHEQRHRYTLRNNNGRWQITGYHLEDTDAAMIERDPEYYLYRAVCGGLAFKDWEGIDSLTPQDLYGLFIAGFSPGVHDTEIRAQSVEEYFYSYTGVVLEDPTILRQSGYYNEETGYYDVVWPEGIEGIYSWTGGYWIDCHEVQFDGDDAAEVTLSVYDSAQRGDPIVTGVMKMQYHPHGLDEGWIPVGFTAHKAGG